MFENVFGHSRLVGELSAGFENDSLPPAILLSGPRYNGKMTVALELSRALTCLNGDAPWSCGCEQCRRHRTLSQTNVALLGYRYFEQEIAVTGRSLLENPRMAGAFLFVRAVRKLTRRFDPWLWPDNRTQKIAPLVAGLEEEITAIEPPAKMPTGNELKNAVHTIVTDAQKLVAKAPYDVTPVDVIRNLVNWTFTTGEYARKVVVLEEVHLLQDSARNALLKTLEEPPLNVYFILTTSRRTAVMPTILSRLRVYEMPKRSEQVEHEIESRIFSVREQQEVNGLSTLFRSAMTEAGQELLHLAGMIVDTTVSAQSVTEELHRFGEILRRKPAAEYLLQLVSAEVGNRLSTSSAYERARFGNAGTTVRRIWSRIDERNMNPLQSIVNLAVELREM